VILGCAVAAVGFGLLANKLPDLDLDSQWPFMVLAGAGVGLILGPANTDAISRAPRTGYGEATGITQTVRNFGSSLGLAVLGTILIIENKSNIESSLGSLGVPTERADQVADALSHGGGDDSGSFAEKGGERGKELFDAVQLDFALASRTVFYVMAAVMAVAFVVSLIAMPSGKVEEVIE
jgi:hypothetical protein